MKKAPGDFRPISWDDALDEVAEAFTRITQAHGSEAVWPYHSGGTMGVISATAWTVCVTRCATRGSKPPSASRRAQSGWLAGVGVMNGVDPREMAEADVIVVWGGNPVSTQVNAMTHIARARKRGAKLVVD